jgi:hypothetical protein
MLPGWDAASGPAHSGWRDRTQPHRSAWGLSWAQCTRWWCPAAFSCPIRNYVSVENSTYVLPMWFRVDSFHLQYHVGTHYSQYSTDLTIWILLHDLYSRNCSKLFICWRTYIYTYKNKTIFRGLKACFLIDTFIIYRYRPIVHKYLRHYKDSE